MKNLWKKEFHAQKTSETAESILKEQCVFLSKQTNGKIIAKVAVYDGSTEINFAEAIRGNPFIQKKNIQDKLGEVEDNKFIFEFYITSRTTPNWSIL